MKRIVIQILCITAITLLAAGCGSKGREASGDASVVRPKEAAAETASLPTEGISAAETAAAETVANASETPAASVNETEAANTGGATADKPSDTQNALLTEEEAKTIALNDAGVTEQEISGIRIKLETEHGVQEYEVDFYAGNAEYDYDIDAVTGEIRSKDMDIDKDFYYAEPSDTEISKEDAIALALSKVSGATESDIRIHRDYDDGRTIYEGSIIYNEKEYDFEIDAGSGQIVEWEEEYYEKRGN